ncbi:MAG: hypothetical protein GW917_00640 [Bdellovibrionales bacterium]|nr:hypothetical protein [Bdellovibrionales bacterium]
MKVLKKVLVVHALALTFGLPAAFASEDGAAAAPEASGASKEGPDSREYREKNAKIIGLEAQIADLNSQIEKLVERKRREKNSEKVREMMGELVTLSNDRNKAVVEHRELKKYLIYRYPNLGKALHQKYGVHQEASVEQLEKSHGLDELLTETKNLIDKKYAPLLKDLPGVQAEKLEKAKDNVGKSLRLVE